MRRRLHASGFTLLEVMIALSILALALTSMAGINSQAFDTSNYAKEITVATLLARSKMLDIEEELRKDGFGNGDKDFTGDFSDEGFSKITYRAVCREVEVDIAQLVSSFLGGDTTSDNLPESVQALVGAMSGEDLGESVQDVEGGDLKQMLGGEALEGVFKGVAETLKNSIREITLEIQWGQEPYQEQAKFVQYVTTDGRLSLRNQPTPVTPGGRPEELTRSQQDGLFNGGTNSPGPTPVSRSSTR